MDNKDNKNELIKKLKGINEVNLIIFFTAFSAKSFGSIIPLSIKTGFNAFPSKTHSSGFELTFESLNFIESSQKKSSWLKILLHASIISFLER